MFRKNVLPCTQIIFFNSTFSWTKLVLFASGLVGLIIKTMFISAAFGGLGGGGQKLKFKKKKKKTDDEEDEGPKIEAPSGPADGAGGWESEMKYAFVY